VPETAADPQKRISVDPLIGQAADRAHLLQLLQMPAPQMLQLDHREAVPQDLRHGSQRHVMAGAAAVRVLEDLPVALIGPGQAARVQPQGGRLGAVRPGDEQPGPLAVVQLADRQRPAAYPHDRAGRVLDDQPVRDTVIQALPARVLDRFGTLDLHVVPDVFQHARGDVDVTGRACLGDQGRQPGLGIELSGCGAGKLVKRQTNLLADPQAGTDHQVGESGVPRREPAPEGRVGQPRWKETPDADIAPLPVHGWSEPLDVSPGPRMRCFCRRAFVNIQLFGGVAGRRFRGSEADAALAVG
jgi:hypothetical protein